MAGESQSSVIPEVCPPPCVDALTDTALWTLYNRASEARRLDGILDDPECVRIVDSLGLDLSARFGCPRPTHAVRACAFDGEVRAFCATHRDPVIVNLGEGLETQRFRLADTPAVWVSVDLPDAMDAREQFIVPDHKHLHVRRSVLDHGWMDEVPPGSVHILAQGLFMFLTAMQVKSLVRAIGRRFPNAWLTFDTIPPWLSDLTCSPEGWRLSPQVVLPPMPFGIRSLAVPRVFAHWIRHSKTCRVPSRRIPRVLPQRPWDRTTPTLPTGMEPPSFWTMRMPGPR